MRSSFHVSHASTNDIGRIKRIADSNRNELGFLPRPKVGEAVENKRIIVIKTTDDEVIGFVIFRHRKTDKQTTLSDICVQRDWRGQGLGKVLLQHLYDECLELKRDFIQLKCPVDLSANAFYKKLGFKKHRKEKGRKRELNVWRLSTTKSRAL
jgi:ribosomal protein S18 acetylase RimI-like enzyme